MTTPSPALKVRSLSCPNCGGNVELRGFAHTQNAVCIQCCSVIDTTTPELRILQHFNEKMRVPPIIPLGSRGKFAGTPYELIGFQVRTITVDGQNYSWHEYLLFNPFQGYRYLIQYDGHWTDVTSVAGMPAFTTSMGRRAATLGGITYKHFQSSKAKSTFVMGEFPWQVRVGEEVQADDYVAPPHMLSAEITKDEITWSRGEYKTGAEIWQAFQLKGQPPPAVGVYSIQPSPYVGKPSSMWKTALILLAVWVVALIFLSLSGGHDKLFEQRYTFRQGDSGEHSFVTDYFEVKGEKPANVDVEVRTDLNNDWANLSLALINETTGQGYDFSKEISYYSGSDSDGSWSEGSRTESVTVPSVPPGRYYLRVEPEMEADDSGASNHSMVYRVTLKKGGAIIWPMFLLLPLLLIPPIVVSVRAAAFEATRWQESDYSSGSSGSSSSDDGDDE